MGKKKAQNAQISRKVNRVEPMNDDHYNNDDKYCNHDDGEDASSEENTEIDEETVKNSSRKIETL